MSAPAPVKPDPRLHSPRTAGLARGALFFLLWMVLMQSAKPADLAVGVFATVCATWASMRLLPPTTGCLNFRALLALLPHFTWESVVAGVDVARRVFDPRLPLRTGFVVCPLGFPPGLARNTFATITSLMPGAVPCDEENGVLVYHCLDTGQAVVEQLWKEEHLFSRAIIAGRRHG